jgi:hypothetical protein
MVNGKHEKSAQTVPNNIHRPHGFHVSLSFKNDGVMQGVLSINIEGWVVVDLYIGLISNTCTFIQE